MLKIISEDDAVKLLNLAGIERPPARSNHVPVPALLSDEMRLYWVFGMPGMPPDPLHGVHAFVFSIYMKNNAII